MRMVAAVKKTYKKARKLINVYYDEHAGYWVPEDLWEKYRTEEQTIKDIIWTLGNLTDAPPKKIRETVWGHVNRKD